MRFLQHWPPCPHLQLQHDKPWNFQASCKCEWLTIIHVVVPIDTYILRKSKYKHASFTYSHNHTHMHECMHYIQMYIYMHTFMHVYKAQTHVRTYIHMHVACTRSSRYIHLHILWIDMAYLHQMKGSRGCSTYICMWYALVHANIFIYIFCGEIWHTCIKWKAQDMQVHTYECGMHSSMQIYSFTYSVERYGILASNERLKRCKYIHMNVACTRPCRCIHLHTLWRDMAYLHQMKGSRAPIHM
jgi:hypothetical protein